MNTADLYSTLMSPWAHVVGWAMLLFIPIIATLISQGEPRILRILLLAWIVRVAYAVYNTYFQTANVDDFEASAYINSSLGFGVLVDSIGSSSDLYTSFCAMVYLAVGRSPLLLEAVNILLSIMTIRLCYKISRLVFGVDSAIVVAKILALFPAYVIFGTLILRESVWIYPATLGIYLWVWGLNKDRADLVLLAIIPFMVAYALHAGALGLLAAWACTPILKILAAGKGGVKQVLLALGAIVIVFGVGAAIMATHVLTSLNGKFDLTTLSVEDVSVGWENAARSRAAYLTNMSVGGGMNIVWQLPIRFIFFIGMPFPWYVKTIKDVAGFLDTLFYFFGFYITMRNWRIMVRNPAVGGLFIACVFTWALFSVGTSNYGTAIRHRAKLVPVACVLFCGVWEVSRRRRTLYQADWTHDDFRKGPIGRLSGKKSIRSDMRTRLNY